MFLSGSYEARLLVTGIEDLDWTLHYSFQKYLYNVKLENPDPITIKTNVQGQWRKIGCAL